VPHAARERLAGGKEIEVRFMHQRGGNAFHLQCAKQGATFIRPEMAQQNPLRVGRQPDGIRVCEMAENSERAAHRLRFGTFGFPQQHGV
jgi:hypothetical protein